MKAADLLQPGGVAAIAVLPLFASGAPGSWVAPMPPQSPTFEELAARCAPDVHPKTLKGIVSTESSWNPFAIGVVGQPLERQPTTLAEAVATARELETRGRNFSLGLAQVNRYNLARYGESYETIFDACRNLKAGSEILKECFLRAQGRHPDEQQSLRAAFSCYYSGNFTRGFQPEKPGQPSYVQKVVVNALHPTQATPVVPAVAPQTGDAAVPVRPIGRRSASNAWTSPAANTPWVQFAGTGPAEPADTGQAPPTSSAQPTSASAPRNTPALARTRPPGAAQSPRAQAPTAAFVEIVD